MLHEVIVSTTGLAISLVPLPSRREAGDHGRKRERLRDLRDDLDLHRENQVSSQQSLLRAVCPEEDRSRLEDLDLNVVDLGTLDALVLFVIGLTDDALDENDCLGRELLRPANHHL